MSEIYTETRFENAHKLIRIGVSILLIYLIINSFAEITELLSDVERKDDFLQSESSVPSEVSSVCDFQHSQFDSDLCYLEGLDSKINSQLISTLWSFIPVTGIVLVFVGILRLASDEYEETDVNSTGLGSPMIQDLHISQYESLSNRVLTLEGEVKAQNDKLSSPRFSELLYGAR